MENRGIYFVYVRTLDTDADWVLLADHFFLTYEEAEAYVIAYIGEINEPATVGICLQLPGRTPARPGDHDMCFLVGKTGS